MARFGKRDKAGDVAGGMFNIGVGEQQVVGRKCFGVRHALRAGP